MKFKKLKMIIFLFLIFLLCISLFKIVKADETDTYKLQVVNAKNLTDDYNGNSDIRIQKKIIKDYEEEPYYKENELNIQVDVSNVLTKNQREVALVIDNSTSMNINCDIDVLKANAISLVNKIYDECSDTTIQLFVNSGSVTEKLAKTDKETIITYINSLEMNSIQNISDVVESMDDSFSEGTDKDKYVILLTDSTVDLTTELTDFNTNGIKVFTVLMDNLISQSFINNEFNSKVYMMYTSDVADEEKIYNQYSDDSISNIIDAAVNNVSIEDIFNEYCLKYFDLSTEDDNLVSTDSGYIYNINKIGAEETKSIVFKLSFKDEILNKDNQDLFKNIIVSENMNVSYNKEIFESNVISDNELEFDSDKMPIIQIYKDSFILNFNIGYEGENPESKIITNGQPYGELPVPTRTGYTFDGWYDSSDNKVESTDTVNVIDDVTLTAKWIAIKTTLTVDPNGGTWEGSNESQNFEQDYSTTKELSNPTATPDGFVVTFNGNSGSSSVTEIKQTKSFDKWTLSDESVLAGTTYTFGLTNETVKANYVGNSITLLTATKTGATLIGWFTDAEEGTKVGDAGDAYTPTEAVTLYAHYENNEYTLTVKPEGGLWNESTDDQSVTGIYNSTVNVPNPVAPNGYTVTLNNEGTETTIVQTKSFEKWTVLSDGSDFTGTTFTYGAANETLTAVYTENSVTLPILEKTGYTFDGWYDDETAGTKVESPYMPTVDITLYARFTANEYKVTFDPNGGTVTPTYKNVVYGQPYGELPIPTKTEYAFGGWYDLSNNKIDSDTIVNITDNQTLKAKWDEIDIELTSEKYKIGENNIDVYEKDDIYLDKIEPKTTVAELKENCITNGDISIFDSEDNILGDDDFVGTNMTIKITKNSQEITLKTVVMGDLDGNGEITATDLSAISQAILNIIDLEEVYFKAADLDDSLVLTATDFSTINDTILGNIELTYDKTKELDENTEEEIVEEVEVETIQDLTEETIEETTEQITDEIIQETTEETTQDTNEESTQLTTEESTQDTNEESTQSTTDETTQDTNDETTQETSGETTEG